MRSWEDEPRHRRVRRVVGALACVVAAMIPTPGAGAEALEPASRRDGQFVRKSTDVPVFATAPTIDGRLDEAIWASAAIVGNLEQWAPGNGTPPTEPTEFLIGRDDENLYIAARFRDSSPEQIKRSQLVQGQAVFNDDYVQIFLDPFDTRRTGYIFYVNPNGVQRDGLALGGMAFSMDWDGIWEADARVDDDGWTAEIALPFKTLAFDPANDVWGINLLRSIRRKREELAWTQQDRRITMDLMGELRGMRGAQQGRGLDVVPSLGFSRRDQLSTGESTLRGRPALDVFYRITPSLTASLTLNTDFSATEVDDRQVNLTRFSLFFPEKRDFFLEGQEVFEFAGLAQNGRPFFSRTIGLSAAGQPIDLDAGAKLTGRAGRYSVGALAVRQSEFTGLEAQDLFVLRGQADLFEQSSAGFIVTSGDPATGRDNRVFGADFTYRDRELFEGRQFESTAWLQRSRTEGLDGRDSAWGLSIAYPNDSLDLYAGVTGIGQNFRPALGFVNRTGIRQYDFRGKLRYRFQRPDAPLRSWLGSWDLRQVNGADGGLQSRQFVASPFTFDTQPGDSFGVDVIYGEEVLQRPFLLANRVLVRTGSYRFGRVRAHGSTAAFRRVSATVDLEGGEFYDGRRFDTRLGLQWRPNEHLFLNAQYVTNRIDLPTGEFKTRVYAMTANVAFNVRWAWLNVAQYDNVSSRVGVNSRLRWLPRSGQAAYFVINHDWREQLDGSLVPVLNETALKLSYTFRF